MSHINETRESGSNFHGLSENTTMKKYRNVDNIVPNRVVHYFIYLIERTARSAEWGGVSMRCIKQRLSRLSHVLRDNK